MVAITHVSNVLGTVNPVAEIIRLAHEAGAVCLIDGAQAIAHIPVDVAALGADFYVFSSHKMYGPCGIGVLYGRRSCLKRCPLSGRWRNDWPCDLRAYHMGRAPLQV